MIFIKVNPIFRDIIDVKKIANQIMNDVKLKKEQVSRFISDYKFTMNLAYAST